MACRRRCSQCEKVPHVEGQDNGTHGNQRGLRITLLLSAPKTGIPTKKSSKKCVTSTSRYCRVRPVSIQGVVLWSALMTQALAMAYLHTPAIGLTSVSFVITSNARLVPSASDPYGACLSRAMSLPTNGLGCCIVVDLMKCSGERHEADTGRRCTDCLHGRIDQRTTVRRTGSKQSRHRMRTDVAFRIPMG